MTIIPDDIATLRRLALETAALWDAEPGTTEHISDSGNSVYFFRSNGQPLILRLTSPAYRTREQLEAEIEFLLHLDAGGVQIGKPIGSREGKFVEDVRLDGMMMLASAFTFAPGIRVMPDSEHWNK